MRYGRTVLEVISSQALLLAAFLYAPFNLAPLLGPAGAGVLAMTFAATVAPVLLARHRARAANREFERKLQRLRELPLA